MEIRPIKIDRFILDDGVGCKNIVGYQNVDGRELEIFSIRATVIDNDLCMITMTEEALQDIVTLLNISISKGD